MRTGGDCYRWVHTHSNTKRCHACATQSSTYLTELQELKNTMTFFFKFFFRNVNRSRNLLSAGHTTYLSIRTRINGWRINVFVFVTAIEEKETRLVHLVHFICVSRLARYLANGHANVPLLESVCRRVLLAIVNSNVQRLLLE